MSEAMLRPDELPDDNSCMSEPWQVYHRPLRLTWENILVNHRTYNNVFCFKLISFGVISYIPIDKQLTIFLKKIKFSMLTLLKKVLKSPS